MTLSGVGVISLCSVLSTGSVMVAGSLFFVCLVRYFLRGVGVAKFGASMSLGTLFFCFRWLIVVDEDLLAMFGHACYEVVFFRVGALRVSRVWSDVGLNV